MINLLEIAAKKQAQANEALTKAFDHATSNSKQAEMAMLRLAIQKSQQIISMLDEEIRIQKVTLQ